MVFGHRIIALIKMFVRIRFLVHGRRRISKELFHVASNEEQILNMDLRDEREPNHLDDPLNPLNRCKISVMHPNEIIQEDGHLR